MPRLWSQYDMPYIPAGMEKQASIMNSHANIDYDKLGEIISQKLASHQQLTMNLDENGFNLSIQKGLQTIEYKNKKLIA